MAFGDEFVSGFLGADYLRDFQHASRSLLTGNQALVPRYKFLFHTYFGINTKVPALATAYGGNAAPNFGVLTKTFQLPSFSVKTETMNQYNRKRIIQTGIEYQPITITLHDDNSDFVRRLWRHYYSYYYADSNNLDASTDRDIYSSDPPKAFSWGYQGSPTTDGKKLPFFTDIIVYGLSQKRWVAYRLVNPIIESWQHDTYDMSAGGDVMQHTLTVAYEYVTYVGNTTVSTTGAQGGSQQNAANQNNVGIAGFPDQNGGYDTVPSPLRAGTRQSILGSGGILDAVGSVTDALGSGNPFDIINAARTVGTTIYNNRDTSFNKVIRDEARQIFNEGSRRALTNPTVNGIRFPRSTGGS